MSQHPAIQPGNVAVITGGASGIGLAAARRLHREGMHIVIGDREVLSDEQVRDLIPPDEAFLARALASEGISRGPSVS